MHSGDDTSRRSRRTSTVTATIDRRRILTMTAAILLVTLALLCLTMFGPGRPLGDVQADMVAIDGAIVASEGVEITIREQPIVTTQMPPQRVMVARAAEAGFLQRDDSSRPR